ncbi:MAG: tRNA (N6-threonylcarbamoyladenosine(37)-N6)-methyltransferase TrmO [Actinomycetota bacterium]
MVPVGRVVSTRDVPEDDGWDGETARIELLEPFDGRALQGLDGFSHCMVVYVFDRASWDESRMTRRPRGNPDWPETGIFAQRGKDRPNRIGVTVCRVVAVEGTVLRVSGLDAIDGTPVLDVKPHMEEFGPRGERRQPSWATELMNGYW